MISTESFGYSAVSGTGNICNTGCVLGGVLCSSSSAGTIAIYDSATTTTSAPVVATMSLTAGTFYRIPAGLANGCYIVIGGTTAVTVFITRT